MPIDIKESLADARGFVNLVIDAQRAPTRKEQENLELVRIGAKAMFDIVESVATDLRRIADALDRRI